MKISADPWLNFVGAETYGNFEIALSRFFLNAAFLPGFSSLFKKQIGARSVIK
ncbi:MAG: hypothetical protein IT314_01730 [Anaerolineales bacterium]|nr:hypothetical protein [Anaerolineales bacterium]